MALMTRCERALEPEGIADGENFLADLNGRGIAERQRDQRFLFWLDFDQSDIVARVGAETLRITGLIAEHNFNCLRAFNDVIVGEDVALCVYYKAGACAFDGRGP